MGAFKAYDIRGVWGEDFNEETVYKVGFFIPALLNTDHVAVGRDVRVSSPVIHDELVRGITDAGADVWDLGLCTTPMVYFATVFLKADASVQITASHNPAKYNGLKISRTGALPVGGDTGLKDLERMVRESEVVPAAEKGAVRDYSYVRGEYLSYLRKFCPDLTGMNVSFDLSNGMSNLLAHDLFTKGDLHFILDEYDGSFPAHEPNPLIEANCAMIKEEVVKNGSDCGVIYDGDADRVMFIDEKGHFIQPDYITAVLGYYYSSRGITGPALQDIRTSRSTTEYLEKLGFSVTTWKVGHAFAKLKIREIDGIFGGELAGHYYFRRDFFNCDSGLLASMLVLTVVKDLKKEGRTLSDLIGEIVAYRNSGEVNFRLDHKDECIRELHDTYMAQDPVRVLDMDGYRIEFDSWWFNVRKSNTEPYLRIVCEARTQEELDMRMGEIRSIIAKYN